MAKKVKTKAHRQVDKRISTEWFYGLDPSENEQLEQAWRNSTYVLDQLKKILDRYQADLQIDQEADYNNPSWPVVRADRNGQLRVLSKILKLLP